MRPRMKLSQDNWDTLKRHGFCHLKSIFPRNELPYHGEISQSISESSRTIEDIPKDLQSFLATEVVTTFDEAKSNLKLNLSKDFEFCAIHIYPQQPDRVLQANPGYHSDPIIARNGALDWHLDHGSYYLHRDHTNRLIFYFPIFKETKDKGNLALIPKDALMKIDPFTARKVEGRGALRFRVVEPDTIEWFKRRFQTNKLAVGEWFAIEDYYDDNPGWQLSFDPEKEKIVPELAVGDCLIMRADVIHKTNDSNIERISVRCDFPPRIRFVDNPTIRKILLGLRIIFGSKKAAYYLTRTYSEARDKQRT